MREDEFDADSDGSGHDTEAAADAHLRALRITGEIEIACSDLERRYDLGAGEALVHLIRVGLRRSERQQGWQESAALAARLADILRAQSAGWQAIQEEADRHRAH